MDGIVSGGRRTREEDYRASYEHVLVGVDVWDFVRTTTGIYRFLLVSDRQRDLVDPGHI